MAASSDNTDMMHAFSVDDEAWYRSAVDPNADLSDRFQYNTMQVLEGLARRDVKGTFFVLGMAAEQAPALIKEIANAGHEVQSHGYAHANNFGLTEEEFREDLLRAKGAIEDITGEEVYAYRAPYFSIDERNMWALDVLAETGHRYDSSIFPLKTSRYGIDGYAPEARILRTSRGNRIIEAPVACFHVLGKRLAVAGGGYFRLWPYWVIRRAWRQLERVERPGIVYMHPHEYDPTEMGAYKTQASLKRRLSQGLGRKAFPGKIDKLLAEFRFTCMRHILEPLLEEMENAK